MDRSVRFLVLLATVFVLASPNPSFAVDDSPGAGHDKWHEQFYNDLRRNDGVHCCNMQDCEPTKGRSVDDHHEVMINGKWVRVLPSKIVRVRSPDGGYHVCYPGSFDGTPENVYCVVLPPEA